MPISQRADALTITRPRGTLSVELEHQMSQMSQKLRASNQLLRTALGAAEEMVTHAMRLQEVTAALSQAQTEDEVADVVLGKGLGVVDSVRGVLARVDGNGFTVIRACGYSAEIEASLLAMTDVDDGPLTHAVKSEQPLWLGSPEDHVSHFPSLYKTLGIAPPGASVAVPLRHNDEIVGALAMFFVDSSAFGAEKQAFTLLLAQAAADALYRARTFDTERIARAGAETLAQARADVLGIVAHDLRNPLNAIASCSSLLLELDQLGPLEQKRMFEVMQRAARRMNRMIGDLLDATQLQAGRLSLQLSDVDARKIVCEAEETLAPAAVERRIHLTALPPERECCMRADEGRVLQVIGNLVGNALKFTAEGGSVSLSARPFEGEVIFSIADNGPGIPLEHHVRLFDRFWQERSGDRRGVGLGLSITKGIIDALGGRIWVDSTPGVGSTFSFALPSVPPAAR